MHRIQQRLATEWLFEEIDRTEFHGTDRRTNITMATDDHAGNVREALHLLTKPEPRHTGQDKVHKNAGGNIAGKSLATLSGAGKRTDVIADVPQHAADRIPDCLIIVDYHNYPGTLAISVHTVLHRRTPTLPARAHPACSRFGLAFLTREALCLLIRTSAHRRTCRTVRESETNRAFVPLLTGHPRPTFQEYCSSKRRPRPVDFP